VAIDTARELMRAEGLFAGVSAGANIAAARVVSARPEHKGQTIVTFLCDTGERYVSSELFDHVRETP
jgi:cysteine synthase A